MTETCDALNRPLVSGDFVFYYSNVYRVKALLKNGHYVRIILLHPSKTTRPQNKFSREMCLIPREDAVAWMLREGITLE